MIHFLIPGDPEIRTGGYGYDRRMASELRRLGLAVTIHRLDDRFPRPDGRGIDHAEEVFGGLPNGSLALVDGLAFGALPAVAARHAGRLRLAALVHHPLALETGLDEAERQRLAESERSALAVAGRVIATSPTTARTLTADYGVPSVRIAVVEPGLDPRPLASGGGGTPRLLCVGTLTPRKGHDLLIAALAGLADLPWTLDVAGSTERDPATADAVRAAVAAAGLADRIRLHGEVADDALDALYRRADLFVLASRHEGYGMVLTEALAYGLPIVATDVGAVRETVGPDAALLVPPEAEALSDAIGTALRDLEPLRRGALAARERLTGWPEAAARLAAELER
ncbi:glycosyltransferase family 4 protein [Inquilinus sp. CAU 1745]|uniref:glycosyltransferase family 4 protein n=1 Tax=Inquilinus sp. CAU 1745 TaxID=3140369 RepID=UPI00325BAA4E